MTTTDIGTEATYLPFRARVVAFHRMSPSFVRVTFRGPDLARLDDRGDDHRIKLAFPTPRPLPSVPGLDWYPEWRRLPERQRNPIRTYTARAVRREACELDVDMVLHGDDGPASRWAANPRIGDEFLIVGPNAGYRGPTVGAAWRQPVGNPYLLLGGDETALPAIACILEGLPPNARGLAVLEVPHPDDVLPLVKPEGVHLAWRPRGDAPHGALLEQTVREAAAAVVPVGATIPVIDAVEPVDEDLVWEELSTACPNTGLQAWLAGESAVIKRLRRHLVRDLGVDKRCVAFMGYWKAGQAEAN